MSKEIHMDPVTQQPPPLGIYPIEMSTGIGKDGCRMFISSNTQNNLPQNNSRNINSKMDRLRSVYTIEYWTAMKTVNYYYTIQFG